MHDQRGKFFVLLTALLTLITNTGTGVAANCDIDGATISGGTTYPPLSWQVDNQLIGTSIELVTLLLSEVGVKAKADAGGPWKRVLHRAKHGQVDILVGVRRNKEREKYLTYVTPAITPSVQSVFVKRGNNFDFPGWEALTGKIGGITLGTSFGPEFDQFSANNLSLHSVRTTEQNFKKLRLGRIDYMLGPLLPTLLYSDLSGDRPFLEFLEPPLIILEEFIAFSNQSDCKKHLAHFNRRISEVVDDGTMDVLLEKYFEIWHNAKTPP
ncbi:MAG: hypothetical protein COB04_09090 [Gammaproteobacteria bacterium]|nr:MAG: hypothetical protein COB04_09090 [Gammaproteobacteria bacterium]